LKWFQDVNINKLSNSEYTFLSKNDFIINKSCISESSEVLSAWLHISNNCNLSCSYCYIKQSNKNMTIETGIKIIDELFERAKKEGKASVKIKYSGGEPLLNFDVIKKLQLYAKLISLKSKIKLQAVILTNGLLLTKEIINEIKELGCKLMVSIDGFQNFNRYGKEDYEQAELLKIINKCKSKHLLQNISITITNDNVIDLPNFVDYCLDKDYPFVFNFYRPNKLSKNDLLVSDKLFIKQLKEAYYRIENKLPNRILSSVLLDKVNLLSAHYYTCDAGRNYIVYNQDGQKYNCQMELENPLQKKAIYNPPVDKKESCFNCEIKYFCTGGCPFISNNNGAFTKSPYCNIYKALYKDVIRLEGLRLLKYEKPYIIENE